MHGPVQSGSPTFFRWDGEPDQGLKNTWPFLVVESERRGGKYSRGDDDNDNDNDGDNDNDDDNDDDDYDDDDDDEDPIEFHPLPPRQLT